MNRRQKAIFRAGRGAKKRRIQPGVLCFALGLCAGAGLLALLALRRQWPALALAALALGAFSACVFFLWHGSSRKAALADLSEMTAHMHQIQLQKRQEQFNALQSQINPHFLYNALDTIRGMAIEREVGEIADIVGALATMFKYSMDYSSAIVTINDEISHVRQYVKIQKLRFPEKFEFEQRFDCDPEELYKVRIPKFTLQPLVENAISHGLRNLSRGGRISLCYSLSDTLFSVVVHDNGVGIPDDTVFALNQAFRTALSETRQERDSQSIALFNIDLRIKLYFGEAYGLHIASTPGLGTDVTITLPAGEAGT